MTHSFEGIQFLINLLPVLIPLALLEFGLMIAALVHLLKRGRVKRGSVALWVVLIILLNIIGPVLYFIIGREDS